MKDRDIAEMAAFYVERMEHLVRLASVTDPKTLLRYIAALHFEMRGRFDALRPELEGDPDPTRPLPN